MQSDVEAIRLYRLAATAGNVDAMDGLGRLLTKKDDQVSKKDGERWRRLALARWPLHSSYPASTPLDAGTTVLARGSVL
jgi:hypothetical protein